MNLFTTKTQSSLREKFTHMRFFETIDSTNEKCKHLCRNCGEFNWVVIANQQTKGRGRYGRIWESQLGSNIYLSFALKNSFKSNIAQLNLYLGVMLFKSIACLYPELKNLTTKWPNDLYIGDKKVAGILIENVSNDLDWIVVGIGINVYSSPNDIPATATSLTMQNCNSSENMRSKIIVEILKNVHQDAEDNYNDEFWKCSKVTQQKEYTYTKRDKVCLGILKKLNNDGSIVIETKEGMIDIFC